MDASHAHLYVQLLVIGVPWTLAHCPGMCGPILVGLRLGDRAGAAQTVPSTLADVAAYQAGRAISYALAGAVVGSCGSLVSAWRWGAASLTILTALVFLVAAAAHIPVLAPRFPRLRLPSVIIAAIGRLAEVRSRRPLVGAASIGALLSALPCGIAIWALALAAASGSAMHGAALMGGLVAITSLPLAAASLLPVAGRRLAWRGPRWLVPACLTVSAVLMFAMAVGAVRASDPCPLCAARHD